MSRRAARRTRLVWLVALGVATATVARDASAQRGGIDVPGEPVPQPADSLYREGTRALTRSNYRRAAELFERLRIAFPRSPYVPDSYYWHAFALQRLDDPRALRQALTVLDEQQLRFPESSTGDDVLALRARIEGNVVREPATAFVNPAGCGERDELLAVQALATLTTIEDADAIRAYLASMLSVRVPCARELRRSAVFLLARRSEADARRMLQVVTERDPDDVVRDDARRALQAPVASSVVATLGMPPRRALGDSTRVMLGDTATMGMLSIGARRGTRMSVTLPQAAHLVVLAVTPGGAIDVVTPASLDAVRRVSSGVVSVDLREPGLTARPTPATLSAAERDVFNTRIEAQLEACMARQTAQAQAEIDRQWRGRPNQQGKPVLPIIAGQPIDVAAPGNVALLAVRAGCEQVASRIAPPPPVTTMLRESVTQPATPDRYLLVLASTRPMSLPWIMLRMGTVTPAGATVRELADRLTAALFEGHPGAWTGVMLPW